MAGTNGHDAAYQTHGPRWPRSIRQFSAFPSHLTNVVSGSGLRTERARRGSGCGRQFRHKLQIEELRLLILAAIFQQSHLLLRDSPNASHMRFIRTQMAHD